MTHVMLFSTGWTVLFCGVSFIVGGLMTFVVFCLLLCSCPNPSQEYGMPGSYMSHGPESDKKFNNDLVKN